MTATLTAAATHLGHHPEDDGFPPELEQALTLVPAKNLKAREDLPDGVLDWQTVGEPSACASQLVESFFSMRGVGSDEGVRRVCATCPLQAACMAHALRYEPWGIWGLTEREREGLGGCYGRRERKHRVLTPREAAESAVAAGIDPFALADALVAVHGDQPDLDAEDAETAPDEAPAGVDALTEWVEAS